MTKEFTADEKSELRAWGLSKGRGSYRRTCPACLPYRRNKHAQCLSITIYADHLVASCHHCEATGATFLEERLNQPFVPPVFDKPKKITLKRHDSDLTEEAVAFLASRSISKETASTFSLVSCRAYFRDIGGEAEAIAFPYIVSGKTLGNKVRAVASKDFICDTALSSLFGLQCIDLAESPDIVVCEGELDPLSFYEAGVLNAVSVPNGSSSFNRSNDDGTMKAQLGFLWDAKDHLDKAKRILIATDNDEPGEKLAEELARRIGRHRCWRVSYPEGCKDANDVLMKHGPAKLKECADGASPWPVDGLYEASKYFNDMDNLFDNGFGDCIPTGIAALDPLYKIAPGLLTVVTGAPNAGKSNFVNQILINIARSHGYVSAICSFETSPAIHLAQLSEMLTQKHFFPNDNLPGERMSREEMESVKPFLMRHFKFMHQDDGAKATVESIVERIKTAVLRWGVQVVVIDPYSYIQRPASMDSETAFIADMLTTIRLTAKLYGVHVFFIAHPSKLTMNMDGSMPVPKGYSISGSAAWNNHPDHGLTVHRLPESNEVEVHVWKTRFSPWFGQNGKCSILYDAQRHVYVSEGWSEFFPLEVVK